VCRLLLMAALILTLSGCIYSHTVEPLMTDFELTPTGDEPSSSEVKSVTYYVTVEWDENGIGTIAKANGIEDIYYADIETTRILRFWKRRRVHIYGR